MSERDLVRLVGALLDLSVGRPDLARLAVELARQGARDE